jgi:hypothetical protein
VDSTAIVGASATACCCLVFFIALFGILTVLLRPKRKVRGELEGVAAAPGRGQETRASLTRLEEEDRRKR